MTREISLWGVGPSILLAAACYAALAGLATWAWPQATLVPAPLARVLLPVAVLLLLVGIPMLVVAARAATRAYRANQLATRSIFAVVRNPIYSAWIVFILPGLVLLSHSWPLLLTPLVAGLVFKLRIHRENEYLERQFGVAYRRYRAEVNELIPFPRRNSPQEPPWQP